MMVKTIMRATTGQAQAPLPREDKEASRSILVPHETTLVDEDSEDEGAHHERDGENLLSPAARVGEAALATFLESSEDVTSSNARS